MLWIVPPCYSARVSTDEPGGPDVRPPSETSLGKRLRGLRERAGLSQEVLAARAGLGLSTLKALERDRRQRPHAHTLVRLAEVLGVSTTDRAALLQLGSREQPRPGSAEDAPAAEPSAPAGLVRLPVPTAPLIGRAAELAEACALLEPRKGGTRLLTLVGPGGIGKTRLALAVAASLANAYPDGVVFVDLAPLSDDALVAATIARTLGLRESANRGARELLLDHLRSRQALLVLDNFEHLIPAAPLLAQVLQQCPTIALLTTSRTALRLRAERRFPVGPLATPPEKARSLQDIADAPAVRLFVERARAVAPSFELESTNADAVAAVCRRLDGMPLAIELAAARAGLLQPAALLHRLERRLPLLTSGAVDLPQRQQTLRETLAWSYDLLGQAERALFRRMAAFAGGSSVEAVEAVCALDAVPPEDVLDQLSILVDNSLIFRSGDVHREPRLGMLELVREYAGEQLADSGEAETVRRRHANFYLQLAERGAPQLPGRTEAAWLQRLDQEHANVCAALDWLTQAGELDLALRLATAATWFWAHRGYFAEARRLTLLLDATRGQSGAVRAAACTAAVRLTSGQGDYRGQALYSEEALRLFRELDDLAGAADAVTNLGVAYWQQSDLDAAEGWLIEGVRLFQSCEDSAGIAMALLPLACVARDRGDFEAARPLFAEARARRLANGDRLGVAAVLNNLGCLELYAGNCAEAVRLAEESLTIRRALGPLREIVWSQALLGKIAVAMHDVATAATYFTRCFEVHAVVGNSWGTALAMEGVAGLEAKLHPERALRLAGAASTMRRSIGRALPPAERPLLAAWLAPARHAVSPEIAQRAWAEGEALSEDQAVAAAQQASRMLMRGSPVSAP
jgi:predicted ATPase/DNA-binding XRE family transcriptional regulator